MNYEQLPLVPEEPRITDYAGDYLSDLADAEEPLDTKACCYIDCGEPVRGTVSLLEDQMRLPACDLHRTDTDAPASR